jgi:hypothetical protein
MATGFDRAAWDGERPLVDPTRRVLTVDKVAVGWRVKTKTGLDGRVDPDGNGVGGIVLDVFDITVVVDADTGEAERVKAFSVIDPWRLELRTLTIDKLDEDWIEPPDSHLACLAISRLAKNIIPDRHGNPPAEDRCVRTAGDMGRLAAGIRTS